MNDQILRLSPPPSIENRIKAALIDEHPYHVVYYNRKEGATPAIREIANGNNKITVLSIHAMERYYKEKDVRFYNCNKRHYDGLQFDIVIADVVPDKKLKEFCRMFPYIKLIALKPILHDLEQDEFIVNGIDLATMEPWTYKK